MNLFVKVVKWIEGLYYSYTFDGGFHKEEQKLKNTYYLHNNPCKGIEHQTIVAMVDGRVAHGGLSDRIRGIVSVYGYCKEKKIPFKLYYVHPFHLEEYLQPADYDWRISPEQISYHPNEAVPILLTCDRLPNKHHRRYLDQVLKKYPHRQIHIYTNSQFLDKDFTSNFSEIFSPRPNIKLLVDKYAIPGNEDFISMTFRFQQLLGDFKEDGCKILSKEEQETLIRKCIEKADYIRRTFHPTSKVLLTSDSVSFVKRFCKEKDYAFSIPGEVVHIDYTSNASYEIYAKTFIDMFTLSKAKKIYLLRTGDMYRSGFGKRASKISGVDFEEISF